MGLRLRRASTMDCTGIGPRTDSLNTLYRRVAAADEAPPSHAHADDTEIYGFVNRPVSRFGKQGVGMKRRGIGMDEG